MTDGALAAVHIYFAGISFTAKTKPRKPIRNGLNAGQIALELREFLDGQRRQLALLVLRRELGLQLDGQLVDDATAAAVVEVLCPGSSHFWMSKQAGSRKQVFRDSTCLQTKQRPACGPERCSY